MALIARHNCWLLHGAPAGVDVQDVQETAMRSSRLRLSAAMLLARFPQPLKPQYCNFYLQLIPLTPRFRPLLLLAHCGCVRQLGETSFGSMYLNCRNQTPTGASTATRQRIQVLFIAHFVDAQNWKGTPPTLAKLTKHVFPTPNLHLLQSLSHTPDLHCLLSSHGSLSDIVRCGVQTLLKHRSEAHSRSSVHVALSFSDEGGGGRGDGPGGGGGGSEPGRYAVSRAGCKAATKPAVRPTASAAASTTSTTHAQRGSRQTHGRRLSMVVSLPGSTSCSGLVLSSSSRKQQ